VATVLARRSIEDAAEASRSVMPFSVKNAASAARLSSAGVVPSKRA
jgi:hypothetical protein